ncbi:MAG: hypothetical protein KDD82_22730 [Planctomycetes bacterium]|nr:hypothetical protein [Planctomycetota bacterium]
MAAPKKNETRKQKRDPNQPVPKRPKKKTLVLKVLLLGALLLVGVWGGLYSVQLGRGPWGWSGEDWSGFATFSQEQVSEAASNASETFNKVDWEAIKDSITENSKQLYGQITGWDDKLDERLAKLRRVEGEEGAEGAAGGPAAAADPSAPPPPQYELDYGDGGDKLREAMQIYKRSFPKSGQDPSSPALQRELRKSKGLFREAHELLSKAQEGAADAGNQVLADEIEEAVVVCGQYLQDCSKREMAR